MSEMPATSKVRITKPNSAQQVLLILSTILYLFFQMALPTGDRCYCLLEEKNSTVVDYEMSKEH